MKKALLQLLIVLFGGVFGGLAQNKIEPEDYDVYRALLENRNGAVISKFTFKQDLKYFLKSPAHKSELSILEADTRKNYQKRNQKPFELQKNFGAGFTVNLVSYENLRPFYDRLKESELAAEKALMEKYGTNTVITFSRAGFNKNKTQALLGVEYDIGLCGTCRESYLVVLSKEEGRWIVKKKILTVIS